MATTYNNLYLDARARLKKAGVEAAQLEAREIVCYAADKSREQLYRDMSLYASSTSSSREEARPLRRISEYSSSEKSRWIFEKDATALVTVWGADGDPLIFDYSWREWTGLIDGYYLKRWEKFYAMLQDHLDAGTNYSEKDLPQTHGRESFRANDFYSTLGDWELQFVSTPDKVRTPITQGDEVETATRLYKKYARLATEYYKDEIEADEIHEGNIFENLGE